MRAFFVFIFSLICFSLLSQSDFNSDKSIYKALSFINKGDTVRSINILKKRNLIQQSAKVNILLAEIYTDCNLQDSALKFYKKAIEIDSMFFPSAMYTVAKLSINKGDYNNALRYATSYSNCKNVVDEYLFETKRIIKNCNFALVQINKTTQYNLRSLGDSVNTYLNEYWPSVTADQNRLIFTRRELFSFDNSYKPIYQENFYESVKDAYGIWQIAQPLNSVNTNGNEGSPSISADGKYLFYTACNRQNGFGRCDIYVSENREGNWDVSKNVGFPVNTGFWEAQPSVSPDGRTLYFVSDRPGGFGGSDIWVSHKDKLGKWKNPINMGNSVNTECDEWSPFIHSDGATLYFSSDGHTGMGGVDIYVSKRVNDTLWSRPINIGYPVNTYNNEKGFVVSTMGEVAYYSSENNYDSDIYTIDLDSAMRPLLSTFFKGIIVDFYTNEMLDANIELYRIDNGELLYNSKSENGRFLFPLVKDRVYALNINRKDYLFYSENIKLNTDSLFTADSVKVVKLKPILPGEQIVLNNILFKTNSSELLSGSTIELSKILELLNQNPQLKIEIHGYTDNIGSDINNQKLSQERAFSVCKYLFDYGISISRVKSVGFGKSNPIADNSTEYGRSLNRRTELFVAE